MDEKTKVLKNIHYRNVIDLEASSDEHKSRFKNLIKEIEAEKTDNENFETFSKTKSIGKQENILSANTSQKLENMYKTNSQEESVAEEGF